MPICRSHLMLGLIAALLVFSPMVGSASAAASGLDADIVLSTKAAKKAEKEQARDEYNAEKDLIRCTTQGTLPCNPTVALTWVPTGGPLCYYHVSVSGFASGDYPVTIVDFFTASGPRGLTVGADGTGSWISHWPHLLNGVISYLSPTGFLETVTVNGISDTSTAAC